MVTEEQYNELVLKFQKLEGKLDKFIASTGYNGVYTSEAPEYVQEYVKERKTRGEKE
jgi:hypothetical protein